MDKHPSTFAKISEPTAPERTNSLTHGTPPSKTSRVNSVPEPAGIDAPSNEKASTTPELELVEIWKPASAAAPPLALTRVAPVTANWKPYKSLSKSYKTSTVSVAQDEPSPPHSPQSSTIAEPLQSPLQSTIPLEQHVPSGIGTPPSLIQHSSFVAVPPHSPAQSSTASPSQTPAQSNTPLSQ